MSSEVTSHVAQTTTGAAAMTVVTGSYVYVPPPQHLLDLQLFLIDIHGLPYDFTIRDLIFMMTSITALWMFRKTMVNSTKNKRRRGSDKKGRDE